MELVVDDLTVLYNVFASYLARTIIGFQRTNKAIKFICCDVVKETATVVIKRGEKRPPIGVEPSNKKIIQKKK